MRRTAIYTQCCRSPCVEYHQVVLKVRHQLLQQRQYLQAREGVSQRHRSLTLIAARHCPTSSTVNSQDAHMALKTL